MNELRRLRDDPAFIKETGCRLEDEELALPAADLAALGARIVALTQSGAGLGPSTPPARPASQGWTLGSGAAKLLLVGALLTLRARAPGTEPYNAVEVVVPLPTTLIGGTSEATPAAPADQTLSVSQRVPDVRSLSVGRPIVVVRTEQVAPTIAPPPEQSAARDHGDGSAQAAPPTGDLAAQLAAFQKAEDLLGGGDGAEARQAYEGYLTTWPGGDFAPEARLGALRATLQLGEHEAAVALAATMAVDPVFAARREDLLAMQAGALAHLGRCAEALAVAGALPRAAAASVRRSCR
jgi:hypothetical protein